MLFQKECTPTFSLFMYIWYLSLCSFATNVKTSVVYTHESAFTNS